MAKNSLRSRYEDLKQEIHSHNYRYHVLDAPVVSDLEFDRLLNELKQIEAEHPCEGQGDQDLPSTKG